MTCSESPIIMWKVVVKRRGAVMDTCTWMVVFEVILCRQKSGGHEWMVAEADLLIRPVLPVQARFEEVPKDDAAAFREKLLRAAYCTAQVFVHQLQQNVPEMALVLIIDETVMKDAHALMQPQAYQSLLAVTLLGAHHHHSLHIVHISCSQDSPTGAYEWCHVKVWLVLSESPLSTRNCSLH